MFYIFWRVGGACVSEEKVKVEYVITATSVCCRRCMRVYFWHQNDHMAFTCVTDLMIVQFFYDKWIKFTSRPHDNITIGSKLVCVSVLVKWDFIRAASNNKNKSRVSYFMAGHYANVFIKYSLMDIGHTYPLKEMKLVTMH